MNERPLDELDTIVSALKSLMIEYSPQRGIPNERWLRILKAALVEMAAWIDSNEDDIQNDQLV